MVYDNLTWMMEGKQSDFMFFPRDKFNTMIDLDIQNQGSANFEQVYWNGNIHTSKIIILFEWESSDGENKIAKMIYRYFGVRDDGEIDFGLRMYRLSHLNEIYKSYGYESTFGSRSKFEFQDETFYL